MQIDSLKVFCDLAETESFTKSAHINGVTQSAVSQQISSLERHFKSLLIERSKKKFRLTREGDLLYDYSKRIIQTFDELHFKIDELKNIISGSIRVATIYSIGLHELPAYMKKFLRAHPTVNVHVEYLRYNEVYEEIIGNTIDIGIVAFPVKDHRIEIVNLGKDQMVLITNPSHPFGRAQKIRAHVISGQKFIGFEPDIPSRRAIDKVLKDKDVDVQYVMEFDNVETVKRAVEIDAGIAIVPRVTVAQEVEKGTLAAVEFEDADFSRPLAAIYRKNKLLSPAMKEFLGVLKSELAEEKSKR
jgi:LysR family transcriptional regulator, transcriptional activator of the cysJI operon